MATHPTSVTRMGRSFTIGIVIVTVLVLVGAGVLAGLVMRQDDEPLPDPPNPGSAAAAFGPVLGSGPLSLPAILGQSPSPDGGGGGGGTVTILGGEVVIPVPPPWRVDGADDTAFLLTQPPGLWLVGFGYPDPEANDAVAFIQQHFDEFVDPETPELERGEIVRFEHPDQFLGLAAMPFSALITEQQGSFPVESFMFVGIRTDHLVLIMFPMATPLGALEEQQAQWLPILETGYASFAVNL